LLFGVIFYIYLINSAFTGGSMEAGCNTVFMSVFFIVIVSIVILIAGNKAEYQSY